MKPLMAAVLVAVFVSPLQAQTKIVVSPGPALPMPAAGLALLDPGKFVWLDLPDAVGPVSWDFSVPGLVALPPDGTGDVFGGVKQGSTLPDWHKAPSKTAVPCLGVAEGSVTISAWGVVDGRAKRLAQLTLQVGPAPPGPSPQPPGPNPPGPTPQPVKSFRVFLTYESGQTITPAQSNVMYGNVVEEYLNANCTGGKAGWRRRDRSLGGENDQTMAALWAAIQPKLTTVPAIAIEVNGRVEILPLEATPAQMVKVLDTYKKGVK